MFSELTKDNIRLYAASVYNNPGCNSHIEFEEDYLRIKYLKTILNKYVNNKKINIRILVNHIICIQNVFPGEATAKILFVELEESTWVTLTTILFYLNLMPDKIVGINNKMIFLSSIGLDAELLEILKEL